MARQTFTIASDPAALRNIRDQVAATEREAFTALRYTMAATRRWLLPRINYGLQRELGLSSRGTRAITNRRVYVSGTHLNPQQARGLDYRLPSFGGLQDSSRTGAAGNAVLRIWVGLNDVRVDSLYSVAEGRRFAAGRAQVIDPVKRTAVPDAFWVKRIRGQRNRPAAFLRLWPGKEAPIVLVRTAIEPQGRAALRKLAPATADQLLREFERQLHVQVSRRR